MKQIDHVYPRSLTNIVGPAGTLRRILKNRDFFLSNDCDITIIDNYCNCHKNWSDKEFSSFKPNSTILKHRIRQWLDINAKNSLLLSILLLIYVRRSIKKTIHSYLKLNRDPDYIIFHSEFDAYYYLKNRPSDKAKVIVFYHSDALPLEMWYTYYPKLRGSWYSKYLMKNFEYVLNKIDACAFICKKGMDNMNLRFPFTINKSHLVINGIDDLSLDQIHETEQIKRERGMNNVINMCSVGSVSIRKGQRLFIEAFLKLDKQTRKRYHMTIIGDGPDLQYCQELVNKNNIQDLIEFIGGIPNIEIYKYLAKTDILISMSSNEGLPISIIEGLRAGLAIISTNVSGCPELLTNENGLLINVNVNDLYYILNNPDGYDWKMMGIHSRELFLKQFTFERMRIDYLKMVNSI